MCIIDRRAACGDTKTEVTFVVDSTVMESTPEQKAVSLSGTIQIVGSTSVEKISNALSEAFMEKYPDVTVETAVRKEKRNFS